jgi:hypothetical protein
MSKHDTGNAHHSVTYLNDQGFANMTLVRVKKISALRHNGQE